jgi:hypothetical protein
MIQNRVVIEGKVISIADWHTTKKGDVIRDLFVEASAVRTQYYCLTQFEYKGDPERDIQVGGDYRFEAYVNGMQVTTENHGVIHMNKIIIAKLWKPG